jgi:hypothetical protein
MNSNHIKKVQSFLEISISKNTQLVAIDLDLTLLKPTTICAYPRWYRGRAQMYEQKGYNQWNALNLALCDASVVYYLDPFKLTEDYALEFLAKINKLKIPMIGITSRGASLALATNGHLINHDIKLGTNFPLQKEISFTLSRLALFRYGVLFTAGQDKGLSLQKLLQIANYEPKYITFIDDERRHIDDILKVFKNTDAYHYTRFNQEEQNIDLKDANIKFEKIKQYSINTLKHGQEIF